MSLCLCCLRVVIRAQLYFCILSCAVRSDTLCKCNRILFLHHHFPFSFLRIISDQLCETNHNSDGFNFDLEMGGFGDEEEEAFAKLLVQLQTALTKARPERDPSRNIASACVGNTKNGVVSPTGVHRAAAHTAMLVDMGLYTSDFREFQIELDEALFGLRKRIGKDHLIAGLSASTDSWKQPGPSAIDLQKRFRLLQSRDVTSVAVFGGNWDFLEAYEAPLREFLGQNLLTK